ncbi:MAG TPA: nucleotidyl transferase AbiEii/AbiGii toxin family protein [Verrucomicrobiales bacterium]|nr:nucleotidyl transferase AbiEii/AbiGii toxin family protein [Verrucomicrobiales bacterium]
MTKKKDELKNVAASVRDRLKKIADKTGEDYNTLLVRYAIERLLFRLSKSKHKKRFVLKGAMLFALWKDTPHRVTRDLDLLGFGESSIEELKTVFSEICAQAVLEDGVIFDPKSVKAEPIRAQELYVGVRVDVQGKIGNARTPIQIDVGFGDATAVDPVDVEFPTLLDMPAPKVRAYRMETSLAEKYSATVSLGMTNTRMKDYFDFWFLGKHFEFDGQELADSLHATLKRRGKDIPTETPVGFTDTFAKDASRQAIWKSFWKKSVRSDPALTLEEVVSFAASFLVPPAIAAAKGQKFARKWKPGGTWK